MKIDPYLNWQRFTTKVHNSITIAFLTMIMVVMGNYSTQIKYGDWYMREPLFHICSDLTHNPVSTPYRDWITVFYLVQREGDDLGAQNLMAHHNK